MATKSPAPRLSDEQRFDWLRLARSENVGPRTFRALIENCGGARSALEALPELARRGGVARPIRVASEREIERELGAAHRIGVRFVAFGEPSYPPLLRQIDAAPPILALRGTEAALQRPAVAIVGSRNASAAGLTMADGSRVVSVRRGMRLSRDSRAESISARTSQAWIQARLACSPADMQSRILRTQRP